MKRQAPFVVDDLRADRDASDPLWPFEHETLREEMGYVRSWLGVPLMVKDQIIGLLRLNHSKPGHFRKDQIEDILTFVYQAAVAITNAQLHERAQQTAALVERARLARELHDSVSQSLTAINMATYAVLHARPTAPSSRPADKARHAVFYAFVLNILLTLGEANALGLILPKRWRPRSITVTRRSLSAYRHNRRPIRAMIRAGATG